jgi:hypothetical protein
MNPIHASSEREEITAIDQIFFPTNNLKYKQPSFQLSFNLAFEPEAFFEKYQ